MSNCLFLYRNAVDDAGATLSASSEAVDDTGATLGAANLADADPGTPWRATGKAAEWARVVWAGDAAVDTVGVWGHNLGQNGAYDLNLYSDAAGATLLLQQSGLIWPQVYGGGEAPMNEATVAGIPVMTDLDDYPPFRLLRLGQTYAARRLDLTLADPDNSASYLQLARLFAGVAWQPTYNYDLGPEYWIEDDDDTEDLGGGAFWAERGKSWRMVRLRFSDLTDSESLSFLADFQRRVRRSKDFLFVGSPDGGLAEWRTALHAVLAAQPVRRQTDTNTWQITLTLRELV